MKISNLFFQGTKLNIIFQSLLKKIQYAVYFYLIFKREFLKKDKFIVYLYSYEQMTLHAAAIQWILSCRLDNTGNLSFISWLQSSSSYIEMLCSWLYWYGRGRGIWKVWWQTVRYLNRKIFIPTMTNGILISSWLRARI